MTVGKNVVFTLLGRNKLSPVFKDAGDDADRLENRMVGWGNTASNVLIGAGAAAAAGLGKAISSAMSFDKTMRMVGIQTGLSGKGLKALSDLAIQMGNDTVFSAADASAAMLELAKGGLSAAQMKAGALKQTMTLAAAGELDMATAATYVSNGMQMFGLEAEKASRVVVALAGGANASSASVESLGLALSQVGPGAKLAGLSIEETVAALSAFDAMGVKGSDAGTSLKTMLMRLIPQTAKASGAMDDLGLKFTDAQGEILPLRDIAERLQVSLKGLSTAQKTSALTAIFGSDAYRAAALMAELGAEGIDKYTRATKDQRAAQKLANAGMQGASGAWESFTGSVETLTIEVGQKLLPAFTRVTNVFTKGVLPAVSDAFGWFGRLPGVVKGTALALIGLTILGPKLGALAATIQTRLVAPLSAARAQVGLLRGAMGGMLSFLGGPWGIALTAATTALGWLAGKFFQNKAAVQELTEALKQDAGAIGKVTRATIAKQLVESGMIETARKAGVSFKLATAAALGQSSAITFLGTKYAILNRKVMDMTAAFQLGRPVDLQHLTDLKRHRDALGDLIDKTQDQQDVLRKSRENYRNQKIAEEAVTKAVGSHSNALDRNTKKGEENRKKLGEVARAALNQTDKLRDNGKSWSFVRDKMEGARKEFISNAVKMGVARDRAKELADKLGLIPGNYNARIHADTGPARRAIDDFVRDQSDREIQIGWATASAAARREFHGIGRAAGGPIPGWMGVAGKDSVPTMLTPNEHVWTVDEVAKFGGHAAMERFRAMVRSGKIQTFAKGGMVQAEDGSWVPRSFYSGGNSRRGMVQAEDGSWVPRSFYRNSRRGMVQAEDGSWVPRSFYNSPATIPVKSDLSKLRSQLNELNSMFAVPISSGGGNAANMALGQQMAAAYGWVGAQWAALRELWIRESGWNSFADNPTSSAFGIPQALTSMHNVGAAYLAGNPAAQIAWGLNYIAGRYGSPLGALAWHNSHNWYDNGGMLMPGVTIAHNNTGRPERVIGPNEQLIDYDRLAERFADALHRKGVPVRVVGGQLNGKLTVDQHGMAAFVQGVAADEAYDEWEFRRRRP